MSNFSGEAHRRDLSSGGGTRTGAALGTQSAANNPGQAAGPLLGGLLFAWRADAPYLLMGALLLVVSIVAARRAFSARRRELNDARRQ